MSLASEVRKETIGNYIQFSANAMYIFECILIFPQEVNAIWARKWSTTTWLYVSARYTSLLYAILVLCPVSDYEVSSSMLADQGVSYSICVVELCIRCIHTYCSTIGSNSMLRTILSTPSFCPVGR
ncbi:hypothetical protein BDY19DRAFT_351324 [Irpex rosettiformis]|uniref:Uncharacterized protein n=1 Tax=Irpex rosettiformis TaxID=378272 RepID=A0ACB8TX24_9APHY|nr:hypothetical protein BDY19DRAFT_351324 [Irpex rosettiformis]